MPRKKNHDCMNLNVLLNNCTGPFKPDMCAYMGKQETCCWYESPSSVAKTRTVVSETRITDNFTPPQPANKPETLMGYVMRLTDELRSMGIDAEFSDGSNIRPTVEIPRPNQPCSWCGGNNYWQRPDGGWVCSRCHPPITLMKKPELEMPEDF